MSTETEDNKEQAVMTGKGSKDFGTTLGEYAVTDENASPDWEVSEEDGAELDRMSQELMDFCEKKGLPMAAMVIRGNSTDEDGSVCTHAMTMCYQGVAGKLGDRRQNPTRIQEISTVQERGLSHIIEQFMASQLGGMFAGMSGAEEDGE